MKVRQGFVSNSSSSSFIVGIAEIVDKAKFDKYIEDNKIVLDKWDQKVITDSQDNSDIRTTPTHLYIDSFDTSRQVERKQPGTMFFAVNIINDEGDCAFTSNRYSDIDYDIDLDFFPDKQQEVYKMFSNPDSGLSIVNNDVTFGAARNG